MSKQFYPDFFNDVFGPIMQPGSSSNFAGMSRVGRIARHTLRSEPARARILFNPGDHFLETLGNMMEDRGLLGGLLDFEPDDERLFHAHELARKAKISYEFAELEQDSPYPAYITFELTGRDGDTATLTAASIGGGMVKTARIDGFAVQWQADTHAVLAWSDASSKDSLDAFTQALVTDAKTDLVALSPLEDEHGNPGVFIEFSRPPHLTDIKNAAEEHQGAGTRASLEWRLLPALLPVVTTPDRQPQLFFDERGWLAYAHEHDVSFVQAAIEYEKAFSGWTDQQIWSRFEYIASTLHDQIHSLEERGYDNAEDTPNLPIYGKAWHAYRTKEQALQDPIAQRILDYAFSTNAKLPGVKIVPGPMGTGGGYLMSALEGIQEARGFSHEKLVEGLVVAAGLGAIAFTHTHASGVAGCVGESGICCAMASGAITWMAGGSGEQVVRAASMALQANEGIPCDPIPGGKEFPCITRTLRASITAPLYADMALAGIDPLIPYHEVLDAIERNIEQTPREKLHGPCAGINCTKTACSLKRFLGENLMEGKLRYEA